MKLQINRYVWLAALIAVNILLSAWWFLHGDIHYDIDISRDFLVMGEMIKNKQLTLIGPHSGVVGGVFHGPAWYYLNLPAFFIGQGNPMFMAWFWWGLSVLTSVIVGWVGYKLFNPKTGFLAALLYSANSILNPSIGLKQFFNPYGAVMLSPLFFYFFIKYLKVKKPIDLLIAFFLLGFIIQFQMAFGIPVLAVIVVFLAYFLFKRKRLKHWFIFPVILLPLSTFILFDLRHDFLQTKSLLNFIFNTHQSGAVNLAQFLLSKLKATFTDSYFLLTQDNIVFAWIYSLLFIVLFLTVKAIRRSIIYRFFIFLYFGYWIITFWFKGDMGTYHWPFLPLIIILFAGLVNYLPKRIFGLIFIPLLLWNVGIGLAYIKDFKSDITERGINSWAYNQLVAETVFKDAAGEDFGYFIFTPDRWVYNQWYALEFIQQKYPKVHAYPFAKKRLTYLIIVDPPKDRFDIDSNGWKISHLKIKKPASWSKKIDVISIQKYWLTDQEQALPVDPYLLNSTFFR